MKKVVIGISVFIVVIMAFMLFSGPSKDNPNSSKPETVSSLQDAHGIAVDRKDSSKVYIATHNGLLTMINDGEFQRVSKAKDDYMGFSAHPTDPNIFFTSGHPSSGGNIGFQKSTDGGQTWQKISDGVNGPVDFHTMAVSQADPNTVYGVYRGQLQRSNDEGKTWEAISTDIGNIITLTTNATNKDTVYAGTADGMYTSQNRGQSWSKVGALGGAVTVISVNPNASQEMIAYTQNQGFVQSKDGGNTWDKVGSYNGTLVIQLAYDPQNPSVLYLINQSLEIHKSTDGGETWKKVR